MGARSKEDRSRLFSVVPTNRARGNGHKSKYRKFYLDTVEAFFPVSVVKHWNRLLKEAVQSPCSL